MERRVTAAEALRFRQAMPVTSMVVYRSRDAFPLCPRCGSAMEREYQGFCDRCGQKLSWRGYAHAQVVSR